MLEASTRRMKNQIKASLDLKFSWKKPEKMKNCSDEDWKKATRQGKT